MPRTSQTFPCEPQSVGAARRFVGSALAEWGAPTLADDVRIVVTELATNVLLHARTPFTLTLALDADHLLVSVADGSSGQPRRRRFDATEATTGRGLRMVAVLARAWGVAPAAAGKAVWCEFAVPSTPDGRDDAEPEAVGKADPAGATAGTLVGMRREQAGEGAILRPPGGRAVDRPRWTGVAA